MIKLLQTRFLEDEKQYRNGVKLKSNLQTKNTAIQQKIPNKMKLNKFKAKKTTE